MAAVDILRDALFGNPPSPTMEPSREGVLAAFASLQAQAITALYAAQAGVTTVGTITERNTFYATVENRSKLVYVNNNNGSATDPANGVYEYVSGAARLAQSFYSGVASIVQPLVDAAEVASSNATTSVASVGRFAPATVTGTTGGNTQLSAPIPGPAIADGGLIQILIPSVTNGSVLLTTPGNGTLVIRDAANAVLSGQYFPAGSLVRLRLNLAGAIWNIVNVSPALSYAQMIASDALGSRKLLQAMYRLPLGLPIAGNPNVIGFSDYPAPADQEVFEVIITQTNTSAAFINANGPFMRIAQPGTGADIAAGALGAGVVAKLQRSVGGGDIALLLGTRPLVSDGVGIPIGSQDDDITVRPWATATKTVVIPGSSNASPDYVASGSQPGQLIAAALNDVFLGGITFVADVQAEQGAPWSSIGGQLGNSDAFMDGAATWVIPFFWMNECRTMFYHDYGGVEAQLQAVRDGIEYIRSKGAEPVLVTGFPPDPRASPSAAVKALDPFYFTDNPTRGSAYSPVQAAPMSPTTQMTPTATDADFMVSRDWTGGGVIRTGFKRLWHVNRAVRKIGAERECVVLDVEWSTYRNCIEPVADLGAGLNTYYNSADPLHPYAPLFQQGVKPPIVEWARAMAEGRNDIRVFRGAGA